MKSVARKLRENQQPLPLILVAQAHSEHCQTSKVERFAKIVSGFYISTKSFLCVSYKVTWSKVRHRDKERIFIFNLSQQQKKLLALGQNFVHTLSAYVHNDRLKKLKTK